MAVAAFKDVRKARRIAGRNKKSNAGNVALLFVVF
jgi:hypothetical protein